MVGKWDIVSPKDRSRDNAYPPLIFTNERGKFENKILYRKKRLHGYWELQGNELVFIGESGNVHKRFVRKGEDYWEGYYGYLPQGQGKDNPAKQGWPLPSQAVL